jgi:hypothetical protein
VIDSPENAQKKETEKITEKIWSEVYERLINHSFSWVI